MAKLIALKSFTLSGQPLKNGDDFEISDKNAKILVAIGKAAYDTAPAEEKQKPQKQKPLLAAPEAPLEKPKRTYTRRDMKAETAKTDAE